MSRGGYKNNALNAIHTAPVSAQSVLSFGEVIKKYRDQNDLSQASLAELLNVTRNTVINWENNKVKPSVDMVITLCKTLGIPLEELFESSEISSTPLSQQEHVLVTSYRKLSTVSQRAVSQIVNSLLQEEQVARDNYLRVNYLVLPLESTPAAAGPGCEFVSIPPKPMFVRKNTKSESADAIIRVSGRSMEPVYRDGDFVYVKYTEDVEDGDDVICSSADGAVIKRKYENKLFSLNKELPYGEKSEDDHVRVVGKVIGIVENEEGVQDPEDKEELEKIFNREIIEKFDDAQN